MSYITTIVPFPGQWSGITAYSPVVSAPPDVSDVSDARGASDAAATPIGLALTPRSFAGTDLPDFLSTIAGNSDLLMHAGDWGDLDEPDSAFDLTATLASQQSMDAVIVISPNSGEQLIRPLDEATRDRYLSSLRRFLTEQQPAYLGLANEVNMLALRRPDEFAQLVDLWDQAIPIVRELSPTTRVFVTFQYERMVGRHDGWFGEAVVAPDWTPIDAFSGADVVGLTSYPSLVFDEPSDAGVDYYRQITNQTDLPVLFTEIGWTADEALPILPGSNVEQDAFAASWELVLSDDQLDVEAAIWTFVFGEQVTQMPFTEMSLFDGAGNPRPAWHTWLSLRD